MFIKPKNLKIGLILRWKCFLEFLALYFFLNFKRLFCYEVEFENRALETQKKHYMGKIEPILMIFCLTKLAAQFPQILLHMELKIGKK